MEADDEVKVLGFWASPPTLRVIWALQHKGVHYKYIEEDITQDHRTQLLLDSNPVYKKVPVLFHRGRAIPDSLVILEYIDETWPDKPLMPSDPYERSLARFWIKFGEDMRPIFYAHFKTIEEEELKKIGEEARKALSVVEERCLGDNKFFGGNEIGIVDIAFGWMCFTIQALEEAATGSVKLMDPESVPRLTAWARAFKEVKIIKENLPDHGKSGVGEGEEPQSFFSFELVEGSDE